MPSFCVLYHNTRKIVEIVKDVVNSFRVNYEVSAFSTITLRTKILFFARMELLVGFRAFTQPTICQILSGLIPNSLNFASSRERC
jgi:hypothetical protein